MKKFIASLSIIVLTLGPTISCASAPTSVVTPAGKAAYSADQVVSAIGIFQDAAISANSSKLISDADTRLIVTFSKGAVATITAAQSGWQSAVITALTQLQNALSPSAQTKYGSYITLIKTIVQGIS